MKELLEGFVRFLNRSPTVFHAAKEVEAALAQAGFSPLAEGARWNLAPGKGYFLTRGDSLVAAFRTPTHAPSSAVLLASHLDSPCLKLKPRPQTASQEIGRFGTEVYGAPLLHTWLDRDLCIAGKIVVEDEGGRPVSSLVKLDGHPVIIPELALHLDRQVNDKGLIVNKQDHLNPVFSLAAKEGSLEAVLKKKQPFKNLLSFDLFLVPLEAAGFVGFDGELIASHKLDNLTSAYAALHGILHATPRKETLQAAIFWDHEEIGSMTQVGADSRFADELLERICISFKMDREDFFRLKTRSLCVSADLAHGLHPSYADKYDAQNAALLGKGVVLKYNANQKYATSAATGGAVAAIAQKHRIPIQPSASRSDIPSGSTVGSIMASQLGIPTVDLGIPGWAMHSIRETAAGNDEAALCSLCKAVLEEA